MARLQTIENKLSEINPAVFQELCDSILIRTSSNYKSITRVGSVTGKQKTRIGTPDTLILLANGKYLMIEYSTNISEGFNKLKDDILKNLDINKTHIKKNTIQEIIICINFNINNAEQEQLKQIVSKKRISFNFWNLDTLAIEINLNHSDLANQYLGLPLDTGQIVSLDRFVEEYNRASQGISAPLNNSLLHRVDELKEINEKLQENNFVILTGKPGVGKTKLALEVIKDYIKNNLSFKSYAISYKHTRLLDDLYSHISLDDDCILLIDDANRIDAIQQILGFYNNIRNGELKILITVRDYALNEVLTQTSDYKKEIVSLNKLNDGQITDIIKGEPFEILHMRYQKEIIRIADGNPRIAVMASLLAKEKQDLSVLSDVSDLFEKYFSTFINDKKEFINKNYNKVLGLIAFFNALPYKNRELINEVITDFGVSFIEFNEAIEKLEKLEILEIQYDYVKIPEQNLATFFFYKAFIKDNLLSFKTLLINHFEKNKHRFRDTVIPANNTFGAEKVMNKLKPYLKEYFENVKNDYNKALDFLSHFWFYLQDETTLFVYNYISNLPQSIEHIYQTTYGTNDFAYKQNPIVELLGNLFKVPNKTKETLQLSIELIRKIPKLLPELIHKIREVLIFDIDDELYNYKRQVTLFNTLIDGIHNKDELSSLIFFELSKTFIKNKFQQTKSERNNSISIYQYPIPNNQIIKDFRKTIWLTTNEYFDTYNEFAFSFIKEYASMYPDVNKEIMEFDIPFVIKIIDENLNSQNFHHCKYVHDQIWWFKKHNFDYPEFSLLERKFTNKLYKKFQKLNWDRLKDKDIYDFNDFQEYDKLKEKELRDCFIFNTLEDFNNLILELKTVFPYLKNGNSNINRIINIIIDENCKKNYNLGCSILRQVRNEELFFTPYIIFNNVLNNQEKIKEIWGIIQEIEFKNKFEWEQSFFEAINDTYLTKEWANELLKSIERNNKSFMIFFHRYEKFLNVSPKLFKDLLKVTFDKNNQGYDVQYWTTEVFVKYFNKIENDIELIKNCYKQQYTIQPHFDIDSKGLFNILKTNPDFLVELIEKLYKKSDDLNSLSGSHLNFSQIWEIKNIDNQIEKVIDVSIENDFFIGIQEHFINTFFKTDNNDFIEKSNSFIKRYIKKNYLNPDKMTIIFDVINHSRKELLEELLLLYLSLNQNLEDFERICIVHSGGIFSGNIIIGDVIAGKWRQILSIIDKSNIGIKLIPIKDYIKKVIESELNNGNIERQRKFIRSY